DDHPVASEVGGFEVREVDVRIASVVVAALSAQYACRRGRCRDQAAVEVAPLDENGLVEVVIEPSLEIVTCHRGPSLSRERRGAQPVPRTGESLTPSEPARRVRRARGARGPTHWPHHPPS